MRLPEKFSSQFCPHVQNSGKDLFEASRTTLYETSDSHLRGEVDGEPFCEIHVFLDGTQLNMECECAVAASGKGCEHLWSALCAADAFGDLGKATRRNIRKRAVIFGSGPPDDESVEAPEETPEAVVYESLADSVSFFEEPVVQKRRSVSSFRESNQSAPRPVFHGSSDESSSGKSDVELIYILTLAESIEAIALDVYWRKKKSNGTYESPKPFGFEPFGPKPDWADDFVLNCLESEWLGRDVEQGQCFKLKTGAVHEYLPHLVETGRFYYRRFRGDEQLTAVHFRGHMRRFYCSIEDLGNGQYVLSGLLDGGEKPLPPEQAVFVSQTGCMIEWDCLDFLDACGAFKWLLRLQREGVLFLSMFEADTLIRSQIPLTESALNEIPEGLQYRQAETDVRGRLYVRTAKFKFRGKEQLHADLSFDYNGVCIGENDGLETLINPSEKVFFKRSSEAEEALRNRLRLLEFRFSERATVEEPGWKLLPANLDRVVRELVEENWLIVAEGKTYRKPVEKEATLEHSRGRDWFDLKGGVTFDNGEEIPLPQLLKLARRGMSSVILDDGSIGVLPLEWLAKYTVLTEIGEMDDESVTFNRSQAFLLTELLEKQCGEELSLEELRRTTEAFTGFKALDPPDSFQGTLRPYQREGLGWMVMLDSCGFGGILADDMGLGKTVQVLALIAFRRLNKPEGPALIVMPRSLIFNWEKEAAKFTPHLSVHIHSGHGRMRRMGEWKAADIVLTTYGTLRNDAPKLMKVRFDYCILDESQAIKNADSAVAKAVKLINARCRLAMSGTPVENHLKELFSQFDFLNPDLFRISGFLQSVASGNVDEDKIGLLAKALKPYILRRTKGEVAKDLPEKSEQVLYCDAESSQLQYYDELKTWYRQRLLKEREQAGEPQPGGNETKKVEILEALLRLRQCACHPGLVNEKYLGASGAKLEVLMDKASELIDEGHKLLIFSQFTSFLKLISDEMSAKRIRFAYLDGQTPDRNEQVREFQENKDCKAFLISLKAGGVGLNLTAADYVFLMDPWWNPAVEAQAIDRAYRIGQKRNVIAYRMIMRNTVEEKVLEMQNDKRMLADSIITQTESFLHTLKKEDLEHLLS